ncbi:MAG TPA: AAA family ATPase [Thermoanaerobaculia bacterium]|nr:AAA family ATPase [Thermoanaerobaculia bacterium]
MRKLESLTIKNFKSVREQTLRLGALNVFIGGNGSGKTNLIEVFRFLREIVNQNLADYTLRKGGSDTLLYFGRRMSKFMQFVLEFSEQQSASDTYLVTLIPTNDDALVIGLEITSHNSRAASLTAAKGISTQRRESNLRERAAQSQTLRDLEGYRVYHFHDTSDHAPVKGTSDVDDNHYLRPQAENLAAFLYWLQEKQPEYLANIRDTIRQIAPFFDDFRLAPSRLNEEKIRLEWKEVGSDAYFNASSLSDGTLRFICLATLLLQPDLPAMILLDEPELGLHPAAVNLLASLLASAATQTQVLVATQSVTLVNQLEPKDVWTVDRQNGQSVFRHLSNADMSGWLEDYSLGELWEKNVLGARP